MKARYARKLLLSWLVSACLLVLFLFGASQWLLEDVIGERVEAYLLVTLDESHFGNTQGRVNDGPALLGIGRLINNALQDLVEDRWFSARKDCAVRLQSIDGVVVDESVTRRQIRITLPRNEIEREAVIGVACAPNWLAAAAVTGFLACLFLALYRLLPPPLSRTHRDWIAYLCERGYPEAESLAAVRDYEAGTLVLNSFQQECLEQLHDPAARNFPSVLQAITDPRVARLHGAGAQWFLLGLRRDPRDLPGALALARAEDLMVIDLAEKTLSIRGLDVPMSSTPLFYLAWYAMCRLEGEGWITNPASNRPDEAVGRDLADLMSRFDGHARAINDLEQAGLKARTLDQNRSKIKDDIVAVLGEELASTYLFEASKHADGVQMRYRLAPKALEIRVITQRS